MTDINSLWLRWLSPSMSNSWNTTCTRCGSSVCPVHALTARANSSVKNKHTTQARIVVNSTNFEIYIFETYDVLTCCGKPWRRKRNVISFKSNATVQFTTILLIIGTTNNIFSTIPNTWSMIILLLSPYNNGLTLKALKYFCMNQETKSFSIENHHKCFS